MVSFDVTEIYGNVPHELGKQAISFWIENYQKHYTQDLSKKFITDGIELILNNNSFRYDHKNYIQSPGTSMGTSAFDHTFGRHQE